MNNEDCVGVRRPRGREILWMSAKIACSISRCSPVYQRVTVDKQLAVKVRSRKASDAAIGAAIDKTACSFFKQTARYPRAIMDGEGGVYWNKTRTRQWHGMQPSDENRWAKIETDVLLYQGDSRAMQQQWLSVSATFCGSRFSQASQKLSFPRVDLVR